MKAVHIAGLIGVLLGAALIMPAVLQSNEQNAVVAVIGMFTVLFAIICWALAAVVVVIFGLFKQQN